VFLEATAKNLQRRVAIVGSMLIIAPMLVVTLAGWVVLQRIEHAGAVPDSPGLSPTHLVSPMELSQMARHLLLVCRKYQQVSVEALTRGPRILRQIGPIHLDGTLVLTWRAKNEVTGQVKVLQTPLMAAGTVDFLPVRDFDLPAPAVDEITKTAGTPATIFQRLNEQGDMLRVASSEKSGQGTRAIGTFVPADGRKGQSAKVLEAILSGKTFIGKEVRGKDGYLTAYEPLVNSLGKVIGALNTVLPEEQIKTQVRQWAAASSANPPAPQLFIFEASGENRGAALVMADQSLEGSNLWNDKDSAGTPYIQEMCSRATQLRADQLAEYKFQKVDRAGAIPTTMTAQFAYVPELDWIVGFAQPEKVSQSGLPAVSSLVWAMWLLFGVSLASTGLALQVWLKFSHDLAPKLSSLLHHLRKDAKQLTAAAVELSHEAKQAFAPSVPATAKEISPEKQTESGNVDSALRHIDASGAWVGELLDSLDQITFATNHLMIAAALESATSPTGGQSIADAADEMRSLVQRCRQAAHAAKVQVLKSRADLQTATPAISTGAKDESSLALRRQADTLLRLAAGIDRTVEGVTAEVGVTEEVN
jgi:hypothetical protein